MAILQVGADGKAPAGAKIGDTIKTAGGDYVIKGGTSGNWQSEKVTTPTSGNTGGGTKTGGGGGGGAPTVTVGASGNAAKDQAMGSIVKTAGGDYKIVAPNTPNASYNAASGHWSVKLDPPGTPSGGVSGGQPQTVLPQGATKTTFKRAGQDVNGYIQNGETFDEQGNRATMGDVITAGGKQYLMTKAGKGMDITGHTTSNVYGRKEDGSIDTDNLLKQLYNVNNTSYDTITGQKYREIASVGEVVQAANGKYYDAVTGKEVAYREDEEVPPEMPLISEDPTIQELAQQYFDEMMKEMKLDPTLSWEEALGRAGQSLNPQYNQAFDSAMGQLDENALRSGFFGQLPTEALKRQTAGTLEVDKLNAINALAAQLFGQSEDSAYKKLGAETSQNQNKLSSMLNLLGIAGNERAYGDNREDTEWEKAFKEAGLMGTYNGQPTLDFLSEQRIAANQAKSGSGSSGGGGGGTKAPAAAKEAKSKLTKTETMKVIKDMPFKEAYKKLESLSKEGMINGTDLKTYADIVYFKDPEIKEMYDRYRTAMGRMATDEERVKYLQSNTRHIDDYLQTKLIEAFGLN